MNETIQYQTLKEVFGYDSFRPGQKEIVDALTAGRDVLAIMPTGAGKSICYQLPALLLPGVTVVVSPLISLMQDQVQALIQMGVRAAYINSSLTENQCRKALANAATGCTKLCTPHRNGCSPPAFCGLLKVFPSRCCVWTKPTVFPSGGRTFGPATCKSRNLPPSCPSGR